MAADAAGIWLLSGGDAWRPNLPVPADSEPHAEVALTLQWHGVADSDLVMTHSPSWRTDGPTVMLTYIAVVAVAGPVRGRWPDALPIGQGLARLIGRPATHAPTAPPAPRYSDVLLHALRHLAFLLDTDAANGQALTAAGWQPHLEALSPVLAGLYSDQHVEQRAA